MSVVSEETLHVAIDQGSTQNSSAYFEVVTALLEQGYVVDGEAPDQSRDEAWPTIVLRDASAPTGAEDAVAVENWSAETAIATVDRAREERSVAKAGAWKPWFPVIDYDRCTNCMQCLSFCLFGVYGVSDSQKIQVQNNDNCKTNCPACSRVCPEAAIMFPKYKAGPINGEPVSAADLEREKIKVDISSLLGGDVYSMLRDRSERAKTRFSKERDSDKALNERIRCLKKLQAQMDLDIPAEALAGLPSADEIARRAAEASAKADAARAANEAQDSGA